MENKTKHKKMIEWINSKMHSKGNQIVINGNSGFGKSYPTLSLLERLEKL